MPGPEPPGHGFLATASRPDSKEVHSTFYSTVLEPVLLEAVLFSTNNVRQSRSSSITQGPSDIRRFPKTHTRSETTIMAVGFPPQGYPALERTFRFDHRTDRVILPRAWTPNSISASGAIRGTKSEQRKSRSQQNDCPFSKHLDGRRDLRNRGLAKTRGPESTGLGQVNERSMAVETICPSGCVSALLVTETRDLLNKKLSAVGHLLQVSSYLFGVRLRTSLRVCRGLYGCSKVQHVIWSWAYLPCMTTMPRLTAIRDERCLGLATRGDCRGVGS